MLTINYMFTIYKLLYTAMKYINIHNIIFLNIEMHIIIYYSNYIHKVESVDFR